LINSQFLSSQKIKINISGIVTVTRFLGKGIESVLNPNEQNMAVDTYERANSVTLVFAGHACG
jgi:hypothetical protein